MKLVILSPRSLLMGLKAIFFHPMLYGAVLFHWAILQTPLPPEKVEESEPEELLAESIPIASSGSLSNLKFKPAPKSKPEAEKAKPEVKKAKPKPKPKPKPNPTAQAIAKSDPALQQKAEEAQHQNELEAKQQAEKKATRKLEEKKATTEESKESSDQDSQQNEDQELETISESNSEEEEQSTDQEEQGQEETNEYVGSGEAGAVGFNLGLLPDPELIFTPESIESYISQVGGLEYQTTVQIAEWMTQTTSVEAALDKVKQKAAYSDYSAEKVSGEPTEPIGTLYKFTKSGEDPIFISFLKSTKRTLKSSTVFVHWKGNPTAS